MVINRGLFAGSPGWSRRGRLIAAAALVASTCSACSTLRPAWKHSAAAKEADAPLASAQEAPAPAVTPAPQTASSSMAYPWAAGATLPSAIANAPTPTVKR